MARPNDLIAYTFKAANYGTNCIAERLVEDGWPIAPSEIDNGHGAEATLDQLARSVFRPTLAGRTIDRQREDTFDSDDFPKVVFRDQLQPEETCNLCGALLADAPPAARTTVHNKTSTNVGS